MASSIAAALGRAVLGAGLSGSVEPAGGPFAGRSVEAYKAARSFRYLASSAGGSCETEMKACEAASMSRFIIAWRVPSAVPSADEDSGASCGSRMRSRPGGGRLRSRSRKSTKSVEVAYVGEESTICRNALSPSTRVSITCGTDGRGRMLVPCARFRVRSACVAAKDGVGGSAGRELHLRSHAAEQDLAWEGRRIAACALQALAELFPLLEAAEDLPLMAFLEHGDDIHSEGAATHR